jgi:hypothetical protein
MWSGDVRRLNGHRGDRSESHYNVFLDFVGEAYDAMEERL